MKISDYIIENDWFSFVENATINCKPSSFPQLLNDYLVMSERYNLKLSYENINKIVELLTFSNNVKFDSPVTISRGSFLTTDIPILPKEINHTWPNAFIFLNEIFDLLPEFEQQFIKNPNFQTQINHIVVNHNIYINDSKKENEQIIYFFHKILSHLDTTELNEFHEKNSLYIAPKYTPKLRTILDRYHLENQLTNEGKTPSIKNKI